jgi:hypothetical protein
MWPCQDDNLLGDLERKDLTAVVVKESARGSQMVSAGYESTGEV